ncbi:MAG: serine protease [Thermodesulfobacteriota bacterium]|nr:serine protease [Thermodesulfobacteriota bacterium]
MSRKRRKFPLVNHRFIFVWLITVFILANSGCATTRIDATATETNWEKYRTVYLFVPENDPRSVFPKVKARLTEIGFDVRSVYPDNPMEGGQGSGFLVSSEGHVITCAHVVGEQKIATLWLKGERFEADVVCSAQEEDLALLRIRKKAEISSLPLRFSDSKLIRMGQDVYTIGFPLSGILGSSPRLNKGLVSAAVGAKDDPDQFQVSVAIQPGNSGGPLFNEDGLVVGVMQSTLDPLNVAMRTGGTLPQNVNFAVKAEIVDKFLGSCEPAPNVGMSNSNSISFDEAKDSVARVYAGVVSTEDLSEPRLICNVYYQSMWDFWYRFRVFHMEFYDSQTGELLLKAGQYRDNPFSTEEKVINKTIEEIRNKFFPQS